MWLKSYINYSNLAYSLYIIALERSARPDARPIVSIIQIMQIGLLVPLALPKVRDLNNHEFV